QLAVLHRNTDHRALSTRSGLADARGFPDSEGSRRAHHGETWRTRLRLSFGRVPVFRTYGVSVCRTTWSLPAAAQSRLCRHPPDPACGTAGRRSRRVPRFRVDLFSTETENAAQQSCRKLPARVVRVASGNLPAGRTAEPRGVFGF